jgi:hypothetical protein
MKDMTFENMEETARDIEFVMRGKKALICVNGYTANKFFTNLFQPVLDRFYTNYQARVVFHKDEPNEMGLREIITPARKVRVPNAHYLLTVIYSAEGGATQLGMIDWALRNASILGVKKVYTLVGLDYQGCSHFPVARLYMRPEYHKEYLPPWEFFKTFAKPVYEEHLKNGTLRYMGWKVPQRNFVKEYEELQLSDYKLEKMWHRVTRGRYEWEVYEPKVLYVKS